jgi:hypothetical protein
MKNNNVKNENTDKSSAGRTTGRGGKESVSRSGNSGEHEDLDTPSPVDETLKNKLDREDAGTGLATDRKQRRG